jgi:hypothetical protein
MSKKNSKKRSGARVRKMQRRSRSRVAVWALVIVASASALIILLAQQLRGSDEMPSQVMTLAPEVIANLTQMPQATALSSEDAGQWRDLRAMVDACDEYSPERRGQMMQHLDWLVDPSGIPPNVILALGSDPHERLVFGMATYTSIQWRLDHRQPDSCLVPIGRRLNELLVALGGEPFDIYDQSSATP